MDQFWFEVLAAGSVDMQRPVRGQRAAAYRPDDGRDTDLWNIGKLIPVYTALQRRRKPP
jgi:hypothetical protein